MYWLWVLKLLNNVGIAKPSPFPFSRLIEDIRLIGSGYPDKISVVPLLEDEDLVYVHHEELVMWLVHQKLESIILSMYQLACRINPLG